MTIEKNGSSKLDSSRLIVDKKVTPDFSLDFSAKAVLVGMAVGVVLLFLIQEAARGASGFCKSLLDRSIFPLSASANSEKVNPTQETANKVIAVKEKLNDQANEKPVFNKKNLIQKLVKNACNSIEQCTLGLIANSKEHEEKIEKLGKKLEEKVKNVFSKPSNYTGATIDQINMVKFNQSKRLVSSYVKFFKIALSFNASFEESELLADNFLKKGIELEDHEDEWDILSTVADFLIDLQKPVNTMVKEEALNLCLEQRAMQNPISPKECVLKIETHISKNPKMQQKAFSEYGSSKNGEVSPKGVDEYY